MHPIEKKEITLLQPENNNKHYEALFVDIDAGHIKLPMFQREFVWEKEQSAKLIDSILKGFPIGTFVFWKTKEELRSYKDVGNHQLPDTPKGDYVQYILDGQQRITSLYAIRKGIRITKEGKEIDYRDIFINLDYDASTDDQIVITEELPGKRCLSVHRILTSSLTGFLSEFPDTNDIARIEYYKTRLTTFDFSTITIKDYPIEIACEVFSRINTSGKSLTVFEVMVAKTYDESKNFDLAVKFEELRDGTDEEEKCLSAAKFETIPESIIMQCVSAITTKTVRSRDILKIQRATFIQNWEPMKQALFSAIDFIRSELRIPVSQLLPYPALLVPLTYFFYQRKNKKATHVQARALEQFFYWVGITERYSSTTESKIAEDLQKIDAILNGGLPKYSKSELVVEAEQIAETHFSAGNAYCKTILCLLAFQQPKSFDTNGIVILDNSNLKIASSRNYHHFFPKDYIRKNYEYDESNLIANITLIDGYSNKHLINAKPPSKYLALFETSNPQLNMTLRSHLIKRTANYGIGSDDYHKFVAGRSKAIADALNTKLDTQIRNK